MNEKRRRRRFVLFIVVERADDGLTDIPDAKLSVEDLLLDEIEGLDSEDDGTETVAGARKFRGLVSGSPEGACFEERGIKLSSRSLERSPKGLYLLSLRNASEKG